MAWPKRCGENAFHMLLKTSLGSAEEVVESLKSQYEEKSRDYEAGGSVVNLGVEPWQTLKKNLEVDFQRVSAEGRLLCFASKVRWLDREKADLELLGIGFVTMALLRHQNKELVKRVAA